MHWGRPINDIGGATFPAGRERQWDQDLYFMMLMNLSGKPGEAHGESSSSSTTGRFGLGFKSVHLVSPSPSVVSDLIAFTIAGGLLPQEQAVPDEVDSWMIESRRPTRVRLPLRLDVEAQTLSAWKGLIALRNVLVDPPDVSHARLAIRDVRGFLSSLWRILASGLNDSDALRRRFLGELHGNGRRTVGLDRCLLGRADGSSGAIPADASSADIGRAD